MSATPSPFVPEDVNPSERMGPLQPIGNEPRLPPGVGAGGQPFQSYMQQTTGTPSPGASNLSSPLQLAGQGTPATSPSNLNTLLAQVAMAQTALGGIQGQLATPGLNLKPSQKFLLKNKMSEATGHLRSAVSKMRQPGDKEEDEEQQKQTAASGPLGKFLGYVSDGQNQLEGAKRMLQNLKLKGQELTPADMLLVQLKLNKAQSLLEYSSVLLGKAVEDIKMLFNIQL